MENKEEVITISKKVYDSLVEDSQWLGCLEAAGVDNWEGYDTAVEMYQEEYKDD